MTSDEEFLESIELSTSSIQAVTKDSINGD